MGLIQYRAYLYTMKVTITTEVEKFPKYGYSIITINVVNEDGFNIKCETITVFDSTHEA